MELGISNNCQFLTVSVYTRNYRRRPGHVNKTEPLPGTAEGQNTHERNDQQAVLMYGIIEK
jgi:hypothetical protein